MDVLEVLENGAMAAVIAVFLFGLYGTANDMGGAETVVSNALDDPQNYGVGMAIYAIGFDIWVPAYPIETFGVFAPVVNIPYFYSGGYVPSFSSWCFIAALVVAGISTAVVWIFCDWSLWVKILFAIIVGFVTYLVSQFVGWLMMGWGGNMLGFDAYATWLSAVEVTLNPVLFWGLLAMIPVSIFAVSRKIGSYFF